MRYPAVKMKTMLKPIGTRETSVMDGRAQSDRLTVREQRGLGKSSVDTSAK